MRLHILSDLHNEFETYTPGDVDADAIILAGDIDIGARGFAWARQQWPSQTILYVTGNHEYYNCGDLAEVQEEMRAAADRYQIQFLENGVFEHEGVRFLGTSLWSDFSLFGAGEAAERAMELAGNGINDFRRIRTDGGSRRLTPEDALAFNTQARDFLRTELAKPFGGRKTVVITHWLPHPNAVAPRFRGDRLSPYFCCDCRGIMADFKIDLWIFGHSHGSTDFEDASGCRVFSNQKGYPHERAEDCGFDAACIVRT